MFSLSLRRTRPQERIVNKFLISFFGLFLLASASHAQTNPSTSCESLSKLTLPQAKVVAAETIPAGAFKLPTELPPWMAGAGQIFKALPPFCRVIVQATPSADSDIRIEVWLPAANWNLKFQAHGNGGFAGDIDYVHLATSILSGYATANTSTGHSASGIDASWALGHPEKVTDFGYRAVHVMTVVAKEVIRAFYRSGPMTSYFLGCSNGGRQALMEAQRFPEDYNGILAGAPANYWTHLLSSGIWNMQALTNDDASYIPAAKIPAIAHAVNAACDAQDGVTDGVLNDPRKCNFKPQTMLCKNGDANDCLTQPQIVALEKLYEGAHDASGKRIFPGFPPGGEEGPGGWPGWIVGPEKGKSAIAAFTYGFFANFVYEKPDWSYNKANLLESVKLADEKTAKILNATDANLAPFKSHGGKLIVYHGWNDPAISALNSIDYFESVRAKLGPAETESFVRLYMLPGVQHCGGGPGADSFGALNSPGLKDAQHNIQTALELWVEKGTPPSSIIAAKHQGMDPATPVKFTRPLCPYPQSAKYKGSGDPNDSSNFACSSEAN
ncbi:MAG: tannase/feruloyl esterase family alpha/beta hydrolase [Acidobacteria bacterium]|nr:tannase/feruloyl esterase family alpha/beta hydrolase [Acidobacteriota bacterium]MBS1864579.1 tannase/feruloyl esterase family alpha/beta hydrolase [Acidobacteriota bacterium]